MKDQKDESKSPLFGFERLDKLFKVVPLTKGSEIFVRFQGRQVCLVCKELPLPCPDQQGHGLASVFGWF